MKIPDLEELLDVISLACLGDTDVRVDVDPSALDDPLGVIGNAVNVLLDDLEYRQREREEALRRVAAMDAKQEFLAYLSHDMQTPMAVLLGAVTVLRTSRSDEDVAATLPLMEHAIERLQRFVSQFLDLARLEADRGLVLEVAPLDVRAVVKRVVELFADDGTIAVTGPAELSPVAADPTRVEQILANLVTNAFKYAGEAPSIVLRDREDGTIEIRVVDHGPGIAADEVDRIFDKFERGSSAPGAGLGLYISRVLAEAHGGTLTVESEPGEGSTFLLCLPTAHGG
ncbi:sensor histidine kinase [Egicoccus sp. AB-alg6-2]|uniref:sensor histidine kinase n=1 Tax=Egicoccus sp. AB-alg6-2 TaxID=3242692 RepID=UPI00359DA876